MAEEFKPVKFGCGRYVQAPGATQVVGREADLLHVKKALIIGGQKALAMNGAAIEKSLKDAGIAYETYTMTTDVTYETLAALKEKVAQGGFDGTVGCGGGKVMDMNKAVGHGCDVPVINVPSSVATFNCWSAMSVMYTMDHKPVDRIWHKKENSAAILDTQALANAPAKLFASGMADAFAKYIETGLMDEGYNQNNTPVGMYCSKLLAGYTNTIILNRGEKAFRDCKAHQVTEDFDACVYANVATTALAAAVNYNTAGVSLINKGATFAHSLYYACKTIYNKETENWLHGEIVGLGCQAEMYAFGRTEFETKNFARFMSSIEQPMSIRDLGIDPTDDNLKKLVDCMMVVWGKKPESSRQVMYDSLQLIKG